MPDLAGAERVGDESGRRVMDLRHPVIDVICPPDDATSVAHWEREMSSAFPPLRMVPSETPFGARFRTVGASDFQLSDLKASSHQIIRAPGTARDESTDFYKVTLQLEGRGVMSQGERQIELLPGTIAVWDTGRSYTLRLDDDFRFLVAMFPKVAVDMPPGLVGELTAMAVSSETVIGSVVAAYLRALAQNMNRLEGAPGNRLARTGLDLLGTLFSTELDLISSNADAGPDVLRRSLLTEICHYVNANLGDPELSVSRIAASFFVSPRHVHNVFLGTGISVAQWIKGRRLEECRRDLADALLSFESVHEIATRWGFVDGAYFSRVFKETYGQSPSSWRGSQSSRSA